MTLPDSLEEIQVDLFRQISLSGQAIVSTQALSLALAARCHEEVRVWVENFARAYDLTVLEAANQTEFRLCPYAAG